VRRAERRHAHRASGLLRIEVRGLLRGLACGVAPPRHRAPVTAAPVTARRANLLRSPASGGSPSSHRTRAIKAPLPRGMRAHAAAARRAALGNPTLYWTRWTRPAWRAGAASSKKPIS